MNGETCVIIPAHNAHVTIDETLRSVRALEIIVVDHGSRGQTAAIARCHAEIDTRARLIERANAGVAAWAHVASRLPMSTVPLPNDGILTVGRRAVAVTPR